MLIELIHLFSTFWMVVIIWFVQIVHYPLFLEVPIESSNTYFKKHQSLISYLVMPGMLVEGASLSYLLIYTFLSEPGAHFTLTFSVILLILIWASTFLIQVPCHLKLTQTPSRETLSYLIKSNWIRTILWSTKLIFTMVYTKEVVL